MVDVHVSEHIKAGCQADSGGCPKQLNFIFWKDSDYFDVLLKASQKKFGLDLTVEHKHTQKLWHKM